MYSRGLKKDDNGYEGGCSPIILGAVYKMEKHLSKGDLRTSFPNSLSRAWLSIIRGGTYGKNGGMLEGALLIETEEAAAGGGIPKRKGKKADFSACRKRGTIPTDWEYLGKKTSMTL